MGVPCVPCLSAKLEVDTFVLAQLRHHLEDAGGPLLTKLGPVVGGFVDTSLR